MNFKGICLFIVQFENVASEVSKTKVRPVIHAISLEVKALHIFNICDCSQKEPGQLTTSHSIDLYNM